MSVHTRMTCRLRFLFFSSLGLDILWVNTFRGGIYEERVFAYMGLTLCCGSVIAISVFFLILSHKHRFSDKYETAMCVLYCSLFALVWGLGLWRGYSSPNHHGKVKDEISNHDEAVEWNDEECEYNTLFWRFALRDEDLIDLSKFEVNGSVQEWFDEVCNVHTWDNRCPWVHCRSTMVVK